MHLFSCKRRSNGLLSHAFDVILHAARIAHNHQEKPKQRFNIGGFARKHIDPTTAPQRSDEMQTIFLNQTSKAIQIVLAAERWQKTGLSPKTNRFAGIQNRRPMSNTTDKPLRFHRFVSNNQTIDRLFFF